LNHKTHMVIFIVLFLAGVSPFLSVFASADDEVTINIHMIEETTRTRFDNPVIVAGILHFINVTVETQDFQELIIKFYEGSSIPDEEDRDETNYYEWKYDTNSQQWIDVKQYDGYTYINNSRCVKTNNIYSFCIGVNPNSISENLEYENWTLEVFKDENSIYSGTVVAEEPKIGIAKTHGDVILFYVDPFTNMTASGHDYFSVKNVGNIPIFINVDYESYDEILTVAGDTKITPDNISTYYITLSAESWKPSIIPVSGTISGKIPDHYILTTAPFTLPTSPGLNAPKLTINVGHGNYVVQPISDTYIVFQYREDLEMSEGEVKDIPVYISGEGVVTFDVRSNENLDILKVFDNQDAEVNTPLEITSTNTSEYNVTVRVKALRENTTGFLYYNLTIGEETETFITQISIGPPVSPAEETITLDIQIIIAILVIICLVIVYVVYTQMKYRRR